MLRYTYNACLVTFSITPFALRRRVPFYVFSNISNESTASVFIDVLKTKAAISSKMRSEENQLQATECFIALIICSTCFGHSYAHHQQLVTIHVLLPRMVCNALVAGGRRSGAGQQAMLPG